MRYVDFLNVAKSVIDTARRNGVRLDDVDNIEMYSNYKRLVSEGHKVEYILQYLSDVYNYSPRHIRRICERMDSELT
jgi:hypothetical protein